uniref:ATP-binding cassette domain-containing protein n=1 Tax=Mailhella sp. TaxID=1981029 RepID=UPI003AB18DE1
LLMAFIGGPLVFLPLLAMPVLLGVGVWLQMAARRSAEKSYRHSMQKNALLVEMVNGLETVKGCMAESRMQRLWEAVAGISAQSSNEARKYSTRAVTFATFVTQLVTVAMVIFGVYRIGAGDMSMGGLIGCNILVGRIMAPLLQLASLLTRLQNSRVSLKALDALMALPSENQDHSACMDFGALSSEFVMENVSFSYPGSQALALDHVSLRVRPGEKIGVIGKMGSGKSTLGKLLIGLYTPSEGSVSFGGVDIRQLATADLRGRVGVLPQEVILFYGTVRDNIALGDPTVNDHLILRASAISGVADFVKKHPSGYGAQVGEQGRNLSGGQRQAVGLARALIRDPDVLILDEPTSNMDVDSELIVQKRLGAIIKNKTLILITHRLSMLRIVDRLVVMEGGKIVMDGPRDVVLRKLQERQKANRPRNAASAGQTAFSGKGNAEQNAATFQRREQGQAAPSAEDKRSSSFSDRS